MNTRIVYGSCYGAAQRYAQALAQKTGIPARPFRQAGSLEGVDTLVYIGGLYAGTVVGLKQTLGKLSKERPPKLLLATVGLGDPSREETVQTIRASLTKQVPEALAKTAVYFHLRGGIDYKALRPRHKLMMALFIRMLKRKPRETMDPDTRTMVDTYGGAVDFVDPEALAPLIAQLT